MTVVLPAAAEELRVRAGSKAWHKARRSGIGASEISAALGISPYSSPRELYWRKRGELAEQFDNERMEWGRRLERAILGRFLADHPELKGTRPTIDKLYRSRERAWQLATPDALVWPFEGGLPVVVEIKTGASREEWGEDGTDDVPVHYRAQVMHSMDAVGAFTAYMPVLFNGRDYRCFTIRRDEKDVRVLRARGAEFWQRVLDGNPPPVDGHRATTAAMRGIYDVRDVEQPVIVPAHLVPKINRAKAVQAAAGAMRDRLENELRDWMGVANKAVTPTGQLAATRSSWDEAHFYSSEFRAEHPDLAENFTAPLHKQRLNVKKLKEQQ